MKAEFFLCYLNVYYCDAQLEFVMMDPYVRVNLTRTVCDNSSNSCPISSDQSSSYYTTEFTVPDKYGIFKFRFAYRRHGFSVLHYEEEISIRPFKHDEYERFIPAAYPYYLSVFALISAFCVTIIYIQVT